MYEGAYTTLEIERMDLMFNSNDFLPEHRHYAKQLMTHFELSGHLASINFENGKLENASRNLDNQQDDLHELIQLKSLKEQHDHQEKQKQIHEWMNQRRVNFSVVRRNQK